MNKQKHIQVNFLTSTNWIPNWHNVNTPVVYKWCNKEIIHHWLSFINCLIFHVIKNQQTKAFYARRTINARCCTTLKNKINKTQTPQKQINIAKLTYSPISKAKKNEAKLIITKNVSLLLDNKKLKMYDEHCLEKLKKKIIFK